jgi:hypothetical protein
LRQLAAAILAPATVAGCARREADRARDASREALRRSGIVPEGGDASRLGRLYLRQHRGDSGLADLDRALGGGAAPPATPEQWRQRLALGLRGDLEAGRCVELDGWALTLTEARLLALASLR